MNDWPCSFDRKHHIVSAFGTPLFLSVLSEQQTLLTRKVERKLCKYWMAHFWDCEETNSWVLKSLASKKILLRHGVPWDDLDTSSRLYKSNEVEIPNDSCFEVVLAVCLRFQCFTAPRAVSHSVEDQNPVITSESTAIIEHQIATEDINVGPCAARPAGARRKN